MPQAPTPLPWTMVLFWALAVVAVLVPAWRIVSRLGYPGFLSIGFLIPVANLVLLWFVGFSRWPIEGPPPPPPDPISPP